MSKYCRFFWDFCGIIPHVCTLVTYACPGGSVHSNRENVAFVLDSVGEGTTDAYIHLAANRFTKEAMRPKKKIP